MKVGELRHKVTIYLKEEIEEVGGAGKYPTQTEIARLWANIEAVSGLTRLDTRQIGEEVTHRVTLRYYPLLSSEHWLKFQDRNFEIKNVKNLQERNQYLELLVREVYDDSGYLQAGIGQVNDPIES